MDMGYVNALVRERAGYAAVKPSRVIAVDEELARLGWCVDSATGGLVKVDANRRAAPKPAVPTEADVEARLDALAAEDATAKRPPRERRPAKAPERAVED